MKRIICFAVATFLLAGCVTRVESIRQDLDTGLESEQGYMLIAVDSSRQLNEIHISGRHGFILTASDLAKGENYILFKAPAGEYEIKKIDINFFFTYKLLGDSWGFSVKPGVISYVGDLKVQTNRWTNVGSFELVNESSEALEFLEEKFPHLLSGRRVEYFGPGKDDFFQLAEKYSRGGVK